MYPTRLLPSREKMRLFVSWENEYLCRLTYNNEDVWKEFDDGTFELNDPQIIIDKTVNSCNFIDSSGNIHCCTSPTDVLIRVHNKEYTRILWNGDDETVPNADEIEFGIYDTKDYYFLKISDFHNYKGKYPYRKNMPDETERIYKITITHTPNRVNVCHFDLNAHNEDEEQPIDHKKRKSTWVKEILHLIRELIQNNALKNLPE